MTVDDFYNAGWRAYRAGFIYSLREQVAEVLICAARCNIHWAKVNMGVQEKARVIRLRGIGHQMEKNYPAAIADYKEALVLYRTIAPERIDVAIILNDLAGIEQQSGDYISAERDFREALRIAKKKSSREGIAACTCHLAGLALDRQDWPAAEALAHEALVLAKGIMHLGLEGLNYWHLAKALARQGRPQEGLLYARQAVEIFTRLRSRKLGEVQDTLKECEEGVQ